MPRPMKFTVDLMKKSGTGYNEKKFFEELEAYYRTGKVPSDPKAFLEYATKNRISLRNLPDLIRLVNPTFGKPKIFPKMSASEVRPMQKHGTLNMAKSWWQRAKASTPAVLAAAGLGTFLQQMYQWLTWPAGGAPWTQYKELKSLAKDMEEQQKEQHSAAERQSNYYDLVYAHLEELARRQQMMYDRLLKTMMTNNYGGYMPY
jgi:hypothetical protein